MLIAITGGIGAGKSVVSRILSCMGYPVYDCDSRARLIMDCDNEIKCRIAEEITAEAVTPSGCLDRTVISAVVFNDPAKLSALNAIVHGAVRRDLSDWVSAQTSPLVFVETAILYQSGLDRMVDAVWEVVAPESVRIDRVCRRNGFTPDHVKARIDSQRFTPQLPHARTYQILNDDTHSLLLQLHKLRVKFKE